MIYRMMDTPAGRLRIVEEADAIVRIGFGGAPHGAAEGDTPLLREAERQLSEYFTGGRHDFSLPLAPKGTPFQQEVWQVLRTIPYGETRTYAQIAEAVGRPRACRAVGMANHRNPIGIAIPCHRVLGADGSLTGYAGGLAAKEALLRLEQELR